LDIAKLQQYSTLKISELMNQYEVCIRNSKNGKVMQGIGFPIKKSWVQLIVILMLYNDYGQLCYSVIEQ